MYIAEKVAVVVVWILLALHKGPLTAANDINRTPFPAILQGDWYSWESGTGHDVTIDSDYMTSLGRPLDQLVVRSDTYDYVFASGSGCLVCVRFLVRTPNVLERLHGPCLTPSKTNRATEVRVSSLCPDQDGGLLRAGQRDGGAVFSRALEWEWGSSGGFMMYRESPTLMNCRHALYGVFQFAWLDTHSFAGECNNPGARIRSCQEPGNQFSIANQKFLVEYRKCEGIKESFDGDREFACLGDWYVGSKHYFAVTNPKESRKEVKYRCFLKTREDDLYLGMSKDPECSVLKGPDSSPIRIRLNPKKEEQVFPRCLLPSNLTGIWLSTARGEPTLTINTTHLLEERVTGYHRRTSVYTCLQHRGKRFLMARQSLDGCQVEYVCFEFLPRHQNIIRFRQGVAMSTDVFGDVCDFASFRKGAEWKYDTLIASHPDPIACPLGGKFRLEQTGDYPLTPAIYGGITKSPLDSYSCQQREADLSVCDSSRSWMVIDTDRCVSLNKDAHELEIINVEDYRLRCVGFWRENLKSYLITHDPSDSVSRFRCWVYERVGTTEIRLSQSVGAACWLQQHHSSSSSSHGAAVALKLTLNERLYDDCPMYYDGGGDPWKPLDLDGITVFHFSSTSSLVTPSVVITTTTFASLLQLLWS